jgi:hypothetical protein
MAQIKKGDVSGLFRVQVGYVDANGYNFGQVLPNEGVGSGITMPSYLISSAKNAAVEMPDRTVVDFTGGDVWTGSLGSAALTLSNTDSVLVAMAGKSKVDQVTNTRWTTFGENIMLPSPPQMFVATSYNIQSKDPDTKGASKWITDILPRVYLSPKGITGAPSFQAAGEYNYTMVPTVGTRFPHGIPFGVNQSFSNNETPLIHVISDNPLYFVGHIAAVGASATISLPYRPVGSAATYATPNSATQPLQVAVNGVLTNATSVNPTTATVVVPGPFTGGEYIGIVYEVDNTYPLP